MCRYALFLQAWSQISHLFAVTIVDFLLHVAQYILEYVAGHGLANIYDTASWLSSLLHSIMTSYTAFSVEDCSITDVHESHVCFVPRSSFMMSL